MRARAWPVRGLRGVAKLPTDLSDSDQGVRLLPEPCAVEVE